MHAYFFANRDMRCRNKFPYMRFNCLAHTFGVIGKNTQFYPSLPQRRQGGANVSIQKMGQPGIGAVQMIGKFTARVFVSPVSFGGE